MENSAPDTKHCQAPARVTPLLQSAVDHLMILEDRPAFPLLLHDEYRRAKCRTVNVERVYILGAGCSLQYGYPAARDFLDALKTYQGSLEQRPRCERLKRCLAQTVGLMEKLNSPTLDRLVLQAVGEIGRQKRSPSKKEGVGISSLETLEDDQIRDAKLSTVALFLERQPRAQNTGLHGYREFLYTIFEGNRDLSALSSPSTQVLTFNYDSLFELAFVDYFGLEYTGMLCYGPECLNSGLDFSRNEAVDIAPGRFSLLKLHGTASLLVAEKYGQSRYGWSVDLSGSARTVDDDVLWPSSQRQSLHPRENPEPLIVFPYEKDRARAGGTSFLFDKYIRATWDHAMKLTESASQIWVAGYSFDPTDRKAMLQLLRKNNANCDIIVQNPDADGICRELGFRYADLAPRLKPLTKPF